MVYPGSGCEVSVRDLETRLECTHRVSESTGLGGEVSSRRIPRNLAHTVVLTGAQKRHVRSWIRLALLDLVVRGEVDIPELEIVLDGKTDSCQNDESTLWRPSDCVDTPVIQTTCETRASVSMKAGHNRSALTQESVIALLDVNVVNVDVVLGQLSRRENSVGFTCGDHGESATLGFPCELRADLWKHINMISCKLECQSSGLLTLELDSLNRVVLLLDSEQLQVRLVDLL